LSVTLVLVNKNKKANINNTVVVEDETSKKKDDPIVEPIGDKEDEPVIVVDPEDEKIIFTSPIEKYDSYDGYSDTLHYNSTLRRYESHKAMDFFAEEGTSVCAVFGGVVESVTNDLLKGYTITIDHGNGLKSIYNSLLDGDNVIEGQAVNKGDVIGEVSVSNRQEYKDGAHLHFAVTENGNYIDPETYLLMQDK
ncbi:MAG: M23 family metallopeptidase, partial [Firmicutes bacterium]|nr:M23 family metallopeptidase [Candidatus Caballimonas caccae]